MKRGHYTMDNSDLYLFFNPVEESETQVLAEITLFYKKNYHMCMEPKKYVLDKDKISAWKEYKFQ